MISLILRSARRSPDSRKFFITCWVMVEAPRTSWPRDLTASITAAAMPRGVVARMLVEVLVLGRDEGLFHHVRDLVRGREEAPLLRELVDDPALGRIDSADRGRRVLRKALVARQVRSVDPEHRAEREGEHAHAERDHREDGAEEGHDETQHGVGSHEIGERAINACVPSVKTRLRPRPASQFRRSWIDYVPRAQGAADVLAPFARAILDRKGSPTRASPARRHPLAAEREYRPVSEGFGVGFCGSIRKPWSKSRPAGSPHAALMPASERARPPYRSEGPCPPGGT